MYLILTAFDHALDRVKAFIFGTRSAPISGRAAPAGRRTPRCPHACVVSRKVDGRWVATRIFPRWIKGLDKSIRQPAVIDP